MSTERLVITQLYTTDMRCRYIFATYCTLYCAVFRKLAKGRKMLSKSTKCIVTSIISAQHRIFRWILFVWRIPGFMKKTYDLLQSNFLSFNTGSNPVNIIEYVVQILIAFYLDYKCRSSLFPGTTVGVCCSYNYNVTYVHCYEQGSRLYVLKIREGPNIR